MREGKIEAADGIRGLALLIVVILHATGLFFPKTHNVLGGTAQPGVWLFFILSSFLLTNKFCQKGVSFSNVASYLFGRIVRIIPIFTVAAISYYFCGLFDMNKLTEIILFKGTYVHFWTIPVEFCFYFVLPVICFVTLIIYRKYSLQMSFVFLLLLSGFLSLLFPYYDLSYQGTMRWYAAVFITGMISSFMYIFTSFKFKWWVADASSIIIMLVFILLSPHYLSELSGTDKNGWLTNAFIFLSPLLSFFVFVQVTSGGFVNFILKTKFMRAMGKYSFSIYLFHILVLFKISPHYKDDFAMYFLSLILCVGLGMISYHVIESPLEKFRHKFMGLISVCAENKDSKNLTN